MEQETHEKLRDELISEIKKVFPHLSSYSSGSVGNVFTLSKNIKNKSWKDSQYYYQDKAELIHFTTLKSLFSIIRDQSIRLYCLENSNDPNEFSFAAKTLDIKADFLPGIKQNYFTLSLCNSSEIGNLDLWRWYGYNGDGIAIKFLFENYDNWENFFYQL